MCAATKKVIVIGGGGNGTVIASAIEDAHDSGQDWELAGYLDDVREVGSVFLGKPILGRVGDARSWARKGFFFVFTLVSVKKNRERIRLLASLGLELEQFATVVHPKANVCRHARLGYGTILMPGAIVNAGASVGNHVPIYGNALIGHDSSIADYCFISNNASIGSFVKLQEGAMAGSNCSIDGGLTIGAWAIVGLGAVVTKDVESNTIVVGNPARFLKETNE